MRYPKLKVPGEYLLSPKSPSALVGLGLFRC